MHIYAFGSVCRGEVEETSDIDLLAITNRYNSSLSDQIFSIYSYKRIEFLWESGNPFAWHLHTESSVIHSSDGRNFLKDLGPPAAYLSYNFDFQKFFDLFCSSKKSIESGMKCGIFDASCIFLSIRNIATCFSLAYLDAPVFSRNSALSIQNYSIDIDIRTYKILERARILSTRGIGDKITDEELKTIIPCLANIENWMTQKLQKEAKHE